MEWASFYNGVARGLSTILNNGDGKDFGLSNQAARSKDLKRLEQAIASQSQRHVSPELQSQLNELESRRWVFLFQLFNVLMVFIQMLLDTHIQMRMVQALLIGNGSFRKSKKIRSVHQHWQALF
jgi:hypothetical protein